MNGVSEHKLNDQLAKYVSQRETEFDMISAERKEQLNQLAGHIQKCRATEEPIRLTFICTHNSRRRHMSQLWAAVASVRYRIDRVETFSGGTEITAFNPRAVAALQFAGFEIEKLDETDNPRYRVFIAENVAPHICFSKYYSDEPNPATDYCAVMTCSAADIHCPNARGAKARVAITYEDPKLADNSPDEVAQYAERSAQIAREMLYCFSLVQ